VQSERETFGKCPDPDCGGDIIEGEKSFYCTNYKKVEDGGKECKVHIPKLVMGNEFDKESVTLFFKNLETAEYQGVTKNGDKTVFKMVYDKEKKEVVPYYPGKEVIGVCPKCKKDVYEGKMNYYCEGKRGGWNV
jgi:hypothetical protein